MSGVYLSYPFCAQKCTFCNFASGVRPRELEDEYHGALLAELRGTEWQWTPETVYLGGGTPSAMEPQRLAELLVAIPGKPWREATIECAPGGLSAERIQSWRESGINRVSLGVQSFIDAELRRTGRRHSAGVVEAEVALLRANGICDLNIDLIAGLPGQTEASWAESLQWIARLMPPHVSVYMLEVDDESRLGNEIMLGGKRYGAPDVPSDERTAAMYETAVDTLEEMGIARYEISNFARPGCESVHNLKYWRNEPYSGFGADAHSFDGLHRWQNAEDAADYVAEQRAAVRPEKTSADAAEEKFFLGLRLSHGVATDGADWERNRATFERFLEAGLLEQQGHTIRLTRRGVLYSNEVFQEFLSAG
jgi:oxygen-independent coproporphyrinogen-3 oxidase